MDGTFSVSVGDPGRLFFEDVGISRSLEDCFVAELISGWKGSGGARFCGMTIGPSLSV